MPQIRISTHALRRYFERMRGFYSETISDREAVREFVELGADRDAARATLANTLRGLPWTGSFSIRRGKLRYVVRDGVLLTIRPTNSPNQIFRPRPASAAPA